MYRLIFLNGPRKGRRLAVQQGTLLIGRDASCQLDLAEDDEVSHRHAELEQRSDGVWIRDLGSLNRTEVNGVPTAEAKLSHGDRVEIGRTQLEFQVIENRAVGSRRRVNPVQVITIVAIAGVFFVQALFVFFQFARGPTSVIKPIDTETNAVAEAAEPAPAAASDAKPAPTSAVAVATAAGTPPSVARSEADEMRAKAAEMRGQLQDIPAPTATVAVTPARELPKAPVVTNPPVPMPVIDAPAEEPFPVREQPPPLIAMPEVDRERPMDQDPLTTRAQEMLITAQAGIARSDLTGADQMLERIQLMAPDFVPAYVERAKLYEKRGMMSKAGEQWAQVLDRSRGTPLYATAAAARQRLARAEVVVSTTRKSLDQRPVATQLPRRIRIVSIDRERFPSTKEYDEMRLLRVNLKPRVSEGDLKSGDVELRVTFYDRVLATGELVPTRASVPDAPLKLDGPWPAGEAQSLTATYVLSKSFRQDEERTTGQKRIYEGYHARVYYRGELQDEDAQPRLLLTRAKR